MILWPCEKLWGENSCEERWLKVWADVWRRHQFCSARGSNIKVSENFYELLLTNVTHLENLKIHSVPSCVSKALKLWTKSFPRWSGKKQGRESPPATAFLCCRVNKLPVTMHTTMLTCFAYLNRNEGNWSDVFPGGKDNPWLSSSSD